MRPGINALGHKVRRNNTKRIAKSEPPCCCGNEALQQVATLAGARAGSRGPLRGPTLPAWALASSGPRPSAVCAPAGRWPAFLRSPRPLLRRGPCPCAGPLRRGAPAAASRPRSGFLRPRFARRVRGPGVPPGSPARPLCAAARLRGLSLPPLRLGSPSVRCGLPPLRSGRPCSAPCSPLRFAWARRVPPCPSAVASVALAAPLLRAFALALRSPAPPARRRWPRRLPAPGACAGRWPACFGLRPPGLVGCAPRACARLAASVGAASVAAGFSPASPPPLPPPLGALGGREASGLGGSRPRPSGSPFLSLLLPWGLTFRRGYDTFVWRGPFRFFGGRPFRGVHGRLENRLVERPGGFFMRSGLPAAAAKSRL